MKSLLYFVGIYLIILQGRSFKTEETGTGCYLNSYGRGVGVPMSICQEGYEKNGFLCYPLCKQGFSGFGPLCRQNCPPDFQDDGAFCKKPSPYGRGVGYTAQKKCEQSEKLACEKYALLWYPKCKEGFHNVGCCKCSPDCINGMDDIIVSCTKQYYGRGAGKALICPHNLELSGALCYPFCQKLYKGIGPVCWQESCPEGYQPCGALCLKDKECTDAIKKIVNVNDAARACNGPGRAGPGRAEKIDGPGRAGSQFLGPPFILNYNYFPYILIFFNYI